MKKYEEPVFYFLTLLTIIGFVHFFTTPISIYFDSAVYSIFFVAMILVPQGILVIWMMRDCKKRNFTSSDSMNNWISIILYLGIIGTTAYYFKIKRNNKYAALDTKA
ncbi:MAG: hypothetical protein GWO07_04835 [Candidatus Dadabacteria bacterium]|nr:hypothetical protein [Candidatus Dadabacteria bacterium]NIV41187.1 hypothetical protein [Candidatus Dadabacteria bacterium]NIX14476.1 hypothetical protein [Candidatus Dadabacteria bacterium]